LILSVTALHDFVLTREYLLLENFSPPTLINSSHLQYLSGIDVGVGATAHYRDTSNHTFIDLDIRVTRYHEKGKMWPHLYRGVDSIVDLDWLGLLHDGLYLHLPVGP